MSMSVESSHSTADNATDVENNSCTTKGFILQLISSVLVQVTPSLKALLVPAVFFSQFEHLAQVCPGSWLVALGRTAETASLLSKTRGLKKHHSVKIICSTQ